MFRRKRFRVIWEILNVHYTLLWNSYNLNFKMAAVCKLDKSDLFLHMSSIITGWTGIFNSTAPSLAPLYIASRFYFKVITMYRVFFRISVNWPYLWTGFSSLWLTCYPWYHNKTTIVGDHWENRSGKRMSTTVKYALRIIKDKLNWLLIHV